MQMAMLKQKKYSRTSMAQIARLPWLIRTRFRVPTKFFRSLPRTNI